MDLPARYSRPILCGTAVIGAINLACTVWCLTKAFPPTEIFYVSGLTLLLLLGLFLLHFYFVMFWKGQRKAHLLMTIFVATAICGVGWVPVAFGNAQKRWFLETGQREFTQTIDAVIRNQTKLTSDHRRLNETYRHFQVWGETNSEGTFSLFFYNETTPRGPHGYLYYSGDWKEQKGGSSLFYLPNSYKPYSHFTNHWYRF